MKTETIRIDHPLAPGREVGADAVWEFPEGLIGLPDYRRFARIALEDAPPFELLAAVDDSSFGLVVVDPVRLVPDYELSLDEDALAPLSERDPGRLQVLVPVVLPTDEATFSLNLKGPLVLSPGERLGIQRISGDERHSLRWSPGASESASPCSS